VLATKYHNGLESGSWIYMDLHGLQLNIYCLKQRP
jgi:hypothetical protein